MAIKFGDILSTGGGERLTKRGGRVDLERPPLHLSLRRWSLPFSPFEYQEYIASVLIEKHKQGKFSGLLCLPTGAGKTATAALSILRISEAKNTRPIRVLWVAPQRELLIQAQSSFRRIWESGVGPSAVELSREGLDSVDSLAQEASLHICFCTIQYLAKNIAKLNGRDAFDIAIFDEAHHAPADVFGEVWRQAAQGSMLALGLTATPKFGGKLRESEVAKLFDSNLIWFPKFGKDIAGYFRDQGILAEMSLRLPAGAEDLPNHIRVGNSPANQIIRDPSYFSVQVRMLKEAEGRLLTFCANREHGQALTLMALKEGANCEYIDGITGERERWGALSRFSANETNCLVGVNLFVEGVDVPAVNSIFLTVPTRSKGRFTQIVGRALRGPKVGGNERTTLFCIWGNAEWLKRELGEVGASISGWRLIGS